mgnify:CR=1 FL=1
MRIFISGPMKGKPNNNEEGFKKAEEKLRSMGWNVFNPWYIQFDDSWTRLDN